MIAGVDVGFVLAWAINCQRLRDEVLAGVRTELDAHVAALWRLVEDLQAVDARENVPMIGAKLALEAAEAQALLVAMSAGDN